MSYKLYILLNHNKYLNYFLILNLIFTFSNCQVKIPLKYFPIFKYNDTNPSEIFKNLILIRLYANIDMGNPKITIQLPLYFDSNEFFICNMTKTNFGDKYFSDLKLFKNSESMKEVDEGALEVSGYFFQLAYSYIDNFYFNNDKYSMEFYLPLETDEVLSGGIGMQLNAYHNYGEANPIEKSFIGALKSKKIINKYYYSIFYNSKQNSKEEEGFLLLGNLPHEEGTDLGYYKKSQFKSEFKKTASLKIEGNIIKNKIKMDKVVALEGTKEELIEDFPNTSFDYLKVEIDYNNGGIVAPKNLQKYFSRVFEKYINSKECFNETFSYGDTHYFYYCKNNKEIISKIKNEFPRIVFKNNDLSSNFTLDLDDIFFEEKDYVFCLLYFDSRLKTEWKLGKPFLKKYQFSFNYEDKYLSYYYKESEPSETTNKGISTTSLLIIIFAIAIIASIVTFLLFRFYLYEKLFRKKRANELDDRDYDYSPKNDNEDHSLNI